MVSGSEGEGLCSMPVHTLAIQHTLTLSTERLHAPPSPLLLLLFACSFFPQGLRFYIGTAEVITRTLQESQDFVYTRGVQREELKQVSNREGRGGGGGGEEERAGSEEVGREGG